MTWFANVKRDQRIIELVKDDVPPKRIAALLHLPNIWIVYRVINKFRVEHLKRQISPNSIRAKKDSSV